ncbi:hypothetical protein TcCL_ESM07257 [Trypanosoma cruzi]|nr:hypothetical protein TcCL_ESM07257 [Trypanosoma cruzi]
MGSVPFRAVGALVAYINCVAGRCCEHDGDQDEFTPREGSTPCPVWGGEAVCLQTVGQNCTTVCSGHSVDITRGGDVHKNPGPRRMASSIFGSLALQASRP